MPEQLNHYRVIGPLAKGGMGEVFVAEDTRLNRRVALKVLSALMASDPERRQRFEREARAVAALNHPNIVTIHSVEEAEGVPFLAMELVEGKPLNEMIPPDGMAVDAVLRIGIAISDAIAFAHQRGITHRDLKPANVVVTPEGRVKVLDFGLAKLRESQLANNAEDLTRLPPTELTGEGRIIGTVSYMSPEQAEGKPLDERTDIFSLGVMLHEMVTGQRPFTGDTNVSIISAILKDTPRAITDINPALPASLERVIRKALAKDASRRYQTAADLRNDLEEVKQDLDSGVSRTAIAPTRSATAGSKRRWIWGAALLALFLLVLGPAIGFMATRWRSNRADRAAQATAFESLQLTRLTSNGQAFLAAVSADGRLVAHVKTDGTMPSLWLRQTASTSDVEIVPPARVRYDGVTFGPDGNHVYYVTYQLTGGVGTVYRVPILGGTPQPVLEDVDSRVSFSPDGRAFTFVRGVPSEQKTLLMIGHVDGTPERVLASLSTLDGFVNSGPSWSPDGRTIVAPGVSLSNGPQGVIHVVDAGTGSLRRLGSAKWANVNDLHFVADGRSFIAVATEYGPGASQLWQIDLSSGTPRRLTNDLNNYTSVSLSADARTIVTVQSETVSNLWVAPGNGADGGVQITRGRSRGDGQNGMDWTPDGRIVFGSNASGRPQIWIIDADGRNERQLTTDQFPSLNPSVSPDGKFVAFQRFTLDGAYVWRMKIDGSEPVALTRAGMSLNPLVGTDGFVYFNAVTAAAPRPQRVPLAGGEPTLVTESYFQPRDISRDGRHLLGTMWDQKARRASASTLRVGDTTPRMISDIPTFGLAWGPGGRSIAYWVPQEGGISIMTATADGDSEQVMKIDDAVFNFKWSWDGKRLAIARGQVVSDVVLMTPK